MCGVVLVRVRVTEILVAVLRSKVVADTGRNAILSTTQYRNALISLVLQDSPARVPLSRPSQNGIISPPIQ